MTQVLLGKSPNLAGIWLSCYTLNLGQLGFGTEQGTDVVKKGSDKVIHGGIKSTSVSVFPWKGCKSWCFNLTFYLLIRSSISDDTVQFWQEESLMWLSACNSTQYAFISSFSSFPLTGKSEFQKTCTLGKKLPTQQWAVAMLHSFQKKCQNWLSLFRKTEKTDIHKKMWTQKNPNY